MPLPNHGTPWFLLITHTTLPEIRDICREILRLYQRAKPNSEKLEKTVSVLKKAQQVCENDDNVMTLQAYIMRLLGSLSCDNNGQEFGG